MDAVVDVKLPDNIDLMSIFSKVIGDKVSNSSSQDLYTRCRMNLAEYPIQKQTPQFFALGLSTISALDEGSGLSITANIIRRPTDGAHWSAPNNIFGETTVVGLSEAKYDYDYNYKTESQIWKENKEFERQNILMSRPPLESIPVGTNMSN